MVLKSIPSSALPSTLPAAGRRAASVAFGLWQTVQAPISLVRLLPVQAQHVVADIALGDVDDRAARDQVPLTAASLNTVFTASRSVKLPRVLTSPAGWPSSVTRSVPLSPAGSATGEVTL
jgi:hypothetical protein